MVSACNVILNPDLPDNTLRTHVFALASREEIVSAVEKVRALVRPPDDVYYCELAERLSQCSSIFFSGLNAHQI